MKIEGHTDVGVWRNADFRKFEFFERGIMSESASAKSAKSLFDKLGGTKSVEAVVDEFYKRVLADTELKPFFAKTNMTWLRMRQVQFLIQALGGPALYKGKGMKEAHAKMTIGQHHFDLVAMHLVDTLTGGAGAVRSGSSKELDRGSVAARRSYVVRSR
jgi:hemoglobin